jgi:hypothetical protein
MGIQYLRPQARGSGENAVKHDVNKRKPALDSYQTLAPATRDPGRALERTGPFGARSVTFIRVWVTTHLDGGYMNAPSDVPPPLLVLPPFLVFPFSPNRVSHERQHRTDMELLPTSHLDIRFRL